MVDNYKETMFFRHKHTHSGCDSVLKPDKLPMWKGKVGMKPPQYLRNYY